MLPQKKGSERWLTFCLLLAGVLLISIADVSAAKIKSSLPEVDKDWPWKPQLELHVPQKFFTGERQLRDVDNWRVLSHVGAPLRIASDSTEDLLQLLELVNFMRADDKGQCPRYATPFRTWYYRFHPDELALLYGERRWAALQRLQEPNAWSLVLRETVGPAVREAEQFIAQLTTEDPPGQLIVSMGGRHRDQPDMRVSLADFRGSVQVISIGDAMEYRLPQLTVDGEAAQRRRYLHHFLQIKRTLAARIAEFDAATMQAQNNLHDSLVELRRAEQDAYDTQVHFKERYKRFLVERHARRLAAEYEDAAARADRLHENGDDGAKTAPSASMSSLKIRVAAPLLRTAEARRAISCQKIYAAWETLRHSGVCWEQEGRAVQLRRLHARHECPDELPRLETVFNGSSMMNERGGCAVRGLGAAAGRRWRMSVAEMMAQREKSGRPPTIAQLYAVLFAVWRAEGGERNDPASESAAERPHEVFNASAFLRFVERFVESGDAVAMAGGWLPRFIRAELHYMAGILGLVTHHHLKSTAFLNASSATGRSLYGKADGVVRGVVHLYESLSAGSHHAAGALATLREHGIFMRQHAKVAMQLLLRSMEAAPSHLLRELLLRPPPRPAAHAEKLTPSSKLGDRTQDRGYLDLSRLLRFEQFYAVDHTFREVDSPFMTRSGVTTLVAVSSENARSSDDAPELEDVYREAEMERKDANYEGGITMRLSQRILKANMLFTGFKGTKHDPRGAECELLVVLRRLGYFCDLNLPSLHSGEWPTSKRPKFIETVIGVPLHGSCPEHNAELYSVLSNAHHTLLSCPGDKSAAFRGRPPAPVPPSETLMTMMHQVLISLSYVHLLHTHQYELSHMYAALSVELSLRLQQLLVERFGRVRQLGHLFSNVGSKSHNATERRPLSSFEALVELAEGSDEVAWAAAVLVEDIERGVEDNEKAMLKRTQLSWPSPDERARRAVERCRSVTDSPFANTEALLLLAVSRWAKRGPLVGNVVNVSDVEKRLSEWTMEPFRLLSTLLRSSPALRQKAVLLETRKVKHEHDEVRELSLLKRASNPAERADKPESSLDVHALFLVCLAAMKRWKSDFPSVHQLDSTSYSVRRTDPFVLASFLLHARDAATQAPLISIEKLHGIAAAASPYFLGQNPHFLPLVDDTVESYAARLLRFAGNHIHALEPSVELLRSGSYGTGFTMDKAASPSSAGLLRQIVVDEAPPRRFRLRALRRVKQQVLESADLQPLLYASDAHSYFNRTRWTYVGTAFYALYNMLLYPFTHTTSERILAEMEVQLQFISPEERMWTLQRFLTDDGVCGMAPRRGGRSFCRDRKAGDHAAKTVAPSGSERQPFSGIAGVNATPEEGVTSVSSFVEAFAQDVHLREHFIACQLFSFTLESGMPEGFSLIFYEATESGNPFLRELANFLADSVFGRWTATVWTEHHLSAQWQREKSDLAIDGSVFTLSAHSPFRYASVEGRQELFARLSRWKAAKSVGAANSSGVDEARDQLLWCSGFLTRKAYYGSAEVYPFGYEGAVYPAADLECLADLNQLTASQGGSTGTKTKWSKVQWSQAQSHVVQLQRDLADRLAYDYDLIEHPPARRFALSESEFRRNVSGLVAATDAMDHQHVHRKRFSDVTTQLVEPWNRRLREITVESLGYGEGTYYNSRLHRVSGYRWGSAIESLWLWVRHFLP
ncbi:hypothetical protein ABL78_4185 [Leptomonas seymouri]|uniref:Transmembrane protein n=1 Tax=Leptomonas seymouri TaxID=5684 RepID=A0A0N1IKH3_LEPSE|nr:hypothetical protein ABL78_4185 [Leptomonas seymouri]|eukprot:KPI86768.1 hypothetical protein ABL78_4185 [Leptomonas seymouri]